MSDDLPRIDKVTSATVRDSLDRLAQSDVLKTGGVNLIGLDAIRAHLADRWPAKRERVWEHVERDLEKRLGPFDMSLRLDEATYLIAMPGVSKLAAQVVCLHALQEILKFFLGESRPADIRVRGVSAIGPDGVTSAPLDTAELVAQAAAPHAAYAAEAEHEQPAKEWRPPLAGRTEAGSFMAHGSRRGVDLRLGVQAVRNLKRGLVTSYLIERATQPPISDPADLLQVDMAMMNYAANLLREHATTGGRLTLHLPVSYHSAASQRSRELALQILRRHRDQARQTCLIELADLDPGVPPWRLTETVALLKPFCLGVLARVQPTLKALAAVKGTGVRGVILEAHGMGHGAEAVARLRAFAEAALPIAPIVIVHGLDSPDLIETAARGGFTHASEWPVLRFEQTVAA